MQKTDPIQQRPEVQTEQVSESVLRRLTLRQRIALVLTAVLAVLMLVLLPPLINVNRFQRRIATSISGSLGRPVHLDRVSLNLLPLPGFTLDNFVVSEDPTFGSEPIIRANEVRATLRLSSLWRGRVEFATISFTDPSVNLVHLPDGRWNIESILSQASRIPAAPTGQVRAGSAPRFPYIEATGARLNLKEGVEKTPYSLTDAEFALWLPNPEQWRLRLQGHPVRTDRSITDPGMVRLEATLGRAASLAEVPLELSGSWRDAPVGQATQVVFGRDAGWRGVLVLETTIRGTVGRSAVQARLRVNDARREDFVPEEPLAVDLECRGLAGDLFHSFDQVRCSWPPGGSGERKIEISGSVPDVRQWRSSTLEAGMSGIPASMVVGWWHVLSSRVPEGVSASGTLSGSLNYDGTQRSGHWDGELQVAGAGLKSEKTALMQGDVTVRSVEQPAVKERGRKAVVSAPVGSSFQLEPLSLELGGREPATLSGQADGSGYTLRLTGMATKARLDALAKAVPQLGDGLEEVLPTDRASGPFRVDLTASRRWGGAQVWRDNLSHPVAPVRRKRG
jgi:AsmA family